MKKVNKIINIALIFMLIGVFFIPDASYALRPPLMLGKDRAFQFSDTIQFKNSRQILQIYESPAGKIDIIIKDEQTSKEIIIVKDSIFVYDENDEVELRRLILSTVFFEEDRVRRSRAIDWWSGFFNSGIYRRHLYLPNEKEERTDIFGLTYDGRPLCSLYSRRTNSRSDAIEVPFSIDIKNYRNFNYTDLGAYYTLTMLRSDKIPAEPLMSQSKSYSFNKESDKIYEKLQEEGVITYAFTDEKGEMFYFISRPGFSEVKTEKVSETEFCSSYIDRNGRVYVSLVKGKKGKLIVENNKRLVTASDEEVRKARNTSFFQQHGSGINWSPDYAKDIQTEMEALLNTYDGNYNFPKALFQTADLLGLNPFEIIKPVLYAHFHPEMPAYEIAKKVSRDRDPVKKNNKEWYVEYLNYLSKAIGNYRQKDIIGIKGVDLPDRGASSVAPGSKTDVEAWERFTSKLWQADSEEYKASFSAYVFTRDLDAQKALRKKPKGVILDKNALDREIEMVFSRDGSGQNVWRFIGDVFGRWRDDIQIEIITFCNLKCPHCLAMPKMMAPTHRGQQIDKERLKNIIRSLRGADKICLTGGEPFLYGYLGKGQKFREALDSGNGVLSEDFLEILRYAKEMGVKEVVIDTNGFAFPVDEAKAREFFNKLPDNLVFELSLDEEHIDELKRHYNREMRDIVRVCELHAKNVRYNLRIKNPEYSFSPEKEVQQLLNKCDYEGRVFKKYKEGSGWMGKTTRDSKVRLSRAKLQGNAVENFNIDKGYNDNYWHIQVEKFAENFFPTNTFLFVGHDGRIFFDAHSGFMPNPPEISYLGDIGQSSIAGVMLDGMIGRFIDFKTHPYLRYLYLAKYFAYTDNKGLSRKCLMYAQGAGREYEEKYSMLTGGVDFADIVDSEYNFLLARHFRIAVIDNLFFGKNIGWLSDIVSVNSGTDVIWDLGRSWYSEYLYPSIYRPASLDLSDAQKHLICAVVRNYINKTPRLDKSLEACSDLILETLKAGKYIDSRSPFFKTTRDGGFAFLFFREPLDKIEIPNGGEGSDKVFGAVVKPFEDHLRYAVEVHMGEHSTLFYGMLSKKLSAYIEQEGDPKRRWVAQQYLDVCRKRIERKWQPVNKPVIEGEPDAKDYFLYYLVNGLSGNERYPKLDQGSLEGIAEKIKEGILQHGRGVNSIRAESGESDRGLWQAL